MKNYIVRKLHSNKTQSLHRIRLGRYEPNTALQDIRPEGNLQPTTKLLHRKTTCMSLRGKPILENSPIPLIQTQFLRAKMA